MTPKGIVVRVISDDFSADTCKPHPWGEYPDSDNPPIVQLADVLPVVHDNDERGLMHDKFTIVDGLYLCTGSFNYTHGADVYNRENIVVTSDYRAVSAFMKNFEEMWHAYEGNRYNVKFEGGKHIHEWSTGETLLPSEYKEMHGLETRAMAKHID